MFRTHPKHIRLGEFADQNETDASDADQTAEETSAEEGRDGGELAADSSDTFEIPEDLAGLSNEDLAALSTQARQHFDTLYGDGAELSGDDISTLGVLTEGIEAIDAETQARAETQAQRDEQAAAMAAKVRRQPEPATDGGGELAAETDQDEDDEAPTDTDEDQPSEEEQAAETVTASGERKATKPLRVNLSNVRSRARTHTPATSMRTSDPKTMKDVVFAGGDAGGAYSTGQGIDWSDASKIVARHLQRFPKGQYQAARAQGRHMREQFNVAAFTKPFDDKLTIRSEDPAHVDAVIRHAINETRLPQRSLVASGGWCAPSETLYDMCEQESRDGILSIPEINVARGGLNLTTGLDFSAIMDEVGFCFTEQNDINGEYAVDPDTGEAIEGPKPCVEVPCPEFEDYRLDVCGLCITAGILQSRAYPEALDRFVRGSLVAHDHKMNGNVISTIVAGSTAVTYPTPQAGTTAPVLTAIELQAEFVKDKARMSRSATLEAVFPFWVRGAIRADLSRRLGVDLLSVTDSQINTWFTTRGINAQFVYDWQSLSAGGAAAPTAYPDTVQFLMYPAGMWLKGTADVITLDTVYDSTLLGENNFTALFTEEGWFVAPTCVGSYVVTVPICPDGATHGGIDVACDGTFTEVA